MIDINVFSKLEMRAGTIEEALIFDKAKKPAYKLKIDFGPYGKKWSSAQITNNYSIEELINRQIIAVMNLGVKKIGNFYSEILVLGVDDDEGNIVLLEPDNKIINGAKVN